MNAANITTNIVDGASITTNVNESTTVTANIVTGAKGADGTDGAFAGRTITGTTNQITVTNGDGVSGDPTLSTPQNIHTTATPTFGSLILTTNGISSNVASNTNRIFGGTSNDGAGVVVGGSTHATIANKGYLRVSATSIVQWDSAALAPFADSTYTLGTSSLYWSNTYTDRLYLNSTADINGSTAGAIGITGLVGLGTTAPTHTLTLPSTSTGIALYNTADQTTNYQRLRQYWNSGVYYFVTEQGGSGGSTPIRIGTFGGGIYSQFNSDSTAGILQVGGSTGNAAAIGFSASPTFTASSGTVIGGRISPVINTSGTNGWTACLINPTITTEGSGAKLLLDAQVGGVSKFAVSNTGKITSALAQTYTATNVTTDRSYDADTVLVAELADIVGTLIADLRAIGIVN
jgi:hypothetical protein